MSTVLPRRRRFTVDEYYRMAEVGILGNAQRLELIEGEIIELAPIGSRHGGTVIRLNRIFAQAFGERALLLIQGAVRLSDISEPQPDVALLRPRADDYTTSHPTPPDVLLILEVADTTVGYDRETKAPLYATAGIAEYWLIDLPADCIHVYRNPTSGGYSDVRILHRGESVSPLAFPDVTLAVQALLP